MKHLHCRMTAKFGLCLLILSLFGTTEAFSPNTGKPLRRISQHSMRNNDFRFQLPKRSINLATSLSSTSKEIENKPSIWKRISVWRKPTSDSRRFPSRIILQRILPVLGVLLVLPLKAAASDTTTMVMSPISASVEFRLTLRLVMAAILGAGLGKERSIAKHSAGVRTMALVAMGASAFTICSIYGFNVFGSKHDPGRMASQVASGVGFVGAGVITSTSHMNGRNIVHGLTTAATIWLSAAVGVACGTGLFQVATAAAALTIFILRLGRSQPQQQATPAQQWRTSNSRQHNGANGSLRKRFIPSELSATPLDWQHTEDDDCFAETHDTAEWDEHHHTVQRILDDEMPPIIQEARQRIEKENHRLSSLIHEEEDEAKHSSSSEPHHKIVVDQDPEIVEIMHNAWNNSTNHHELHIQNMQRFADYANKTIVGAP
mmetsp:Transcript_34660/g.84065  ORF Transcript_34660/g.84065 Transcript_34660/m.84065 type:complete len:432 (+) Transcript_34660:83-1378(+)